MAKNVLNFRLSFPRNLVETQNNRFRSSPPSPSSKALDKPKLPKLLQNSTR
jgi:hypothetical protein